MLIPLHGIASRRDLPLPFSFVVVGAVLALVISFAILIFAWRSRDSIMSAGTHCQAGLRLTWGTGLRHREAGHLLEAHAA